MRPLFHPSVEEVTVEGILHALSDPVRVAIFVGIAGSDCSQNCSNYLKVSEKSIPKSTLSQHFKALREAGLIRGERRGRFWRFPLSWALTMSLGHRFCQNRGFLLGEDGKGGWWAEEMRLHLRSPKGCRVFLLPGT